MTSRVAYKTSQSLIPKCPHCTHKTVHDSHRPATPISPFVPQNVQPSRLVDHRCATYFARPLRCGTITNVLSAGASGGFGSHLVRTALERGDRVIAAARTLESIKSFESQSCKLLQLDVTESEESLKEKAKQAVGYWGRVDVLVNNAGLGGASICEEAG